MRPGDASDTGEGGFALIEVLAAVAIAGLMLSAAAGVMAASQAAVRSASDRATLVAAARSLLEGMPWTEGLRVGTTTGVLGAIRWRIEVAPADQPADRLTASARPNTGWADATITVSLRSPSGRSMRVGALGLLAPAAGGGS